MQTKADDQGQTPQKNEQRRFVQWGIKNSTWSILVDWPASLPA